MILLALLLVTNQAEPIKGLLTAVHSFVKCCPFVHSPVPLDYFMTKPYPGRPVDEAGGLIRQAEADQQPAGR